MEFILFGIYALLCAILFMLSLSSIAVDCDSFFIMAMIFSFGISLSCFAYFFDKFEVKVIEPTKIEVKK